MTDELVEQATKLVDLIRAQNWKNGGVLAVDRGEAVGAVLQALKAAHAEGVVAGTEATGNSMLRVFDAVTGRAS